MGGGGGWGGGVGLGGQGGCERRIEVEGVRWGGGGLVGQGVRMDVNAMLGVGVMWGIGDVNQE